MPLVYKTQDLYIILTVILIPLHIFPRHMYLTSAQVLEGCLEKCGDVVIPYPFGTTEGCYMNSDFFLNCTRNKLHFVLEESQNEVVSISLNGQLRILTDVGMACYNKDGSQSTENNRDAILVLPRFPISNTHNKFTAVGCDTVGFIGTKHTTTGCVSLCNGDQSLENINYDGSCSGVGCCQTALPENCYDYSLGSASLNNTDLWEYSPCSYMFVAAIDRFNFSQGDLMNLNNRTQMETVLDWSVGNRTCNDIKQYPAEYVCHGNSRCIDATNGPGYRCSCLDGFEGNPYMSVGCQDIDECAIGMKHPCGENEHCINNIGNYTCSCNDGFKRSTKAGSKICVQKVVKPVIQITVGIAVGLAAFLIIGSWLYWGYNKRRHLLRRQKFFEQNGGLMLQQELAGKEGYTETAKIFTAKELKEATNNFDESRIIGRGGFGTVYKGILEDHKVIAIKKSKVMDQDQIEQFINEVIVLSQINHRNVVRLLGCCLETEVPLLVYEYVSNGTLHEHIHEKKNLSEFLSWETRLRIAAEVAGVLAYLHSDASVSIIHRDIKCTNILLDDNHTAKVSDFGASRLVPIDQDTLLTMVQGTIGYLDPEYLQTSQLTEKSDVYSFGVVLVELITGKKALAFDRPEEERCLAMLFILAMKSGNLFSVVDDGLASDGNREQILNAANLALACLQLFGDERPSMRELASELQGLILMWKQPRMDATRTSVENKHLLGSPLLDGNW